MGVAIGMANFRLGGKPFPVCRAQMSADNGICDNFIRVMTDQRSLLAQRFRKQEGFATGYSPLYALLFGLMAGWLENNRPDPLVEWLLSVSAGRADLDVSLLLMAGIHREILRRSPDALELARFFPTAGGAVPDAPTAGLGDSLRHTILSHRDSLEPLIRRATVQTNETARGLAWLLPLAHVGWPAVHLIELGASAGLNLTAERRSYQLKDDSQPPRHLLTLGTGTPPQFVTTCRGEAAGLDHLPCCPEILSRTGLDLAPFYLQSAADELNLSSFVWGDQASRLERLREGIAAVRSVAATSAPVRLVAARLPEELPAFLAAHSASVAGAPVVVYNTTMAMYLPDEGQSLGGMLDRWAKTRPEPVMWVQWEMFQDDENAPGYGHHAWTVDLWHRGRHRRWHLAWVHPHGTNLEWNSQVEDFFKISIQI
jgi:hypothetical protein